jgi:hypothetical protein
MSKSFSIELLTDVDTRYVRTIRASRNYVCGRNIESDVGEDEPTQYLHLPGCTHRYQFALLWDESEGTFVLCHTASRDLTRINNVIVRYGHSRSLRDGDVIEIERDSIRRAMDSRVPPSFLRILFRAEEATPASG